MHWILQAWGSRKANLLDNILLVAETDILFGCQLRRLNRGLGRIQ